MPNYWCSNMETELPAYRASLLLQVSEWLQIILYHSCPNSNWCHLVEFLHPFLIHKTIEICQLLPVKTQVSSCVCTYLGQLTNFSIWMCLQVCLLRSFGWLPSSQLAKSLPFHPTWHLPPFLVWLVNREILPLWCSLW